MPADIPGAPRLGAPFLVMAGDKPVLTEKHGLAAPALWDFNGDGKRDLLVGEFETNSSKFPMGADGSTVRVYLNVGTDSDPKFSEQFEWARDTEGTVMEVPQWCCIGFTPQFFDLDDDGHKDMITGQYHPGEVMWFRGSAAGFMPGKTLPQEGNPASNGQPDWRDYDGEEGDIGTFQYWGYTSATFGDLDDDGDYDLIVGGSGGLRSSENVGGRKTPSFAMRERLLDIEGRALQTRPYTEAQLQSARSGGSLPPASDFKTNPLAIDWDTDGVLDLLVTDSYREPDSRAVSFFRGVKTPDGHRFEPGIDLLPAENGAKALSGSGPRVYVDDWNRDGVNDLIVGASVATVNGGEFSDELSWEWEAVNGVESAGKDPGRYPPPERPTRESLGSYVSSPEMTEEEIEERVQRDVRYWEETVGRLYRENKGHWLTMRHQGRIYVMLGQSREGTPATAEVPSRAAESRARRSPSATPTHPPVTLAFVAPEKFRAREATDLAVSFTMRPGWYIYAPTGRNAQQGMIETSVTFELPDGVLATGGRRLPLHHFKGPYDIYEGADRLWAQPVEAGAPGPHEIVAKVTYQTCRDDLCLPPRTETLRTTLTVDSAQQRVPVRGRSVHQRGAAPHFFCAERCGIP